VPGGEEGAGANRQVLSELVGLLADNRLEIPISASYPLTAVQDAYRQLETGHVRGKIVLMPW
jgi:NADPH:quinone reductase-like Zn-dependent oxidoreductase